MSILAYRAPFARQLKLPLGWVNLLPRLVWSRPKSLAPSAVKKIDHSKLSEIKIQRPDPILTRFNNSLSTIDLTLTRELSEFELYGISKGYHPSDLHHLLSKTTLHQRRALVLSTQYHLKDPIKGEQPSETHAQVIATLLQLTYAPTLAVRHAAVLVLSRAEPLHVLDRLAELALDSSEELELRLLALTCLGKYGLNSHLETIKKIALTGLPVKGSELNCLPALPKLANELLGQAKHYL